MSTDRDVLLTRREVERLCRLGRSTLYKKMRDGTFPVPLKISERAVRWRESEIRAYVDSRPRSMGIRQHDQKKRPDKVVGSWRYAGRRSRQHRERRSSYAHRTP